MKKNIRLAYMYGIAEQTVKNHFTHIYEKAWVPGRKEFRELFIPLLMTSAMTTSMPAMFFMFMMIACCIPNLR